jgi:hypothetical protein
MIRCLNERSTTNKRKVLKWECTFGIIKREKDTVPKADSEVGRELGDGRMEDGVEEGPEKIVRLVLETEDPVPEGPVPKAHGGLLGRSDTDPRVERVEELQSLSHRLVSQLSHVSFMSLNCIFHVHVHVHLIDLIERQYEVEHTGEGAVRSPSLLFRQAALSLWTKARSRE